MKDSLQKSSSNTHLKDGKVNNSMENKIVTETKDSKDFNKEAINVGSEETHEVSPDISHHTTDDVSTHQEVDAQTEELASSRGDENIRLKEELLRLHADVDNTKKRLTRLFEDRVKDKTIAILKDIIEHIDNFERAFDSHKQMTSSNTNSNQQNADTADTKAIFDGFGIIKNQLLSTLQNNWGLNTIESLNKEFNPDEHEAIMQENSEKVKQPTVVQEFMKGYTYLGKVIRPAKVKVALPKDK